MIDVAGEDVVFPVAAFNSARSEENVIGVHLTRLPLAAYPVSYTSQEQQATSAMEFRMIRLCRLLGLIELSPEHTLMREGDHQMMLRTGLFEGMFIRV